MARLRAMLVIQVSGWLRAAVLGSNDAIVSTAGLIMGVTAADASRDAILVTGFAGLVAGAVLALTPVATLMFRFNNPDALLVLLLVAAAYTTIRATEQASLRWLVATGVLVGFAFLTKSLQAFLPLPAFALVYLIAAPTTAITTDCAMPSRPSDSVRN